MIIICINLIWNTKVLCYSFLVNLICLQNKDTKANHCTKGHLLCISAGCQRLLPNSRIWHHGNKNVFHIPGSNVISFSIDPQVFPRVPGHLPHLPYHLTECFVRLWVFHTVVSQFLPISCISTLEFFYKSHLLASFYFSHRPKFVASFWDSQHLLWDQ